MVKLNQVLFGLGTVTVALGARVRRQQSVRHVSGARVHERSNKHTEEATAWTMMMQPGTTDDHIQGLCKGRCAAMGSPSRGGVPFATFHGSESELAQLMDGQHRVDYVEPEHMEMAIPESKELLSSGPSSAASASWGLDRVGVPSRANHGQGVNIYVVDTGVLTTHQEFGGRAIPTLATNKGKKTECKGDVSCARDGNGHGTHCAGTAGGSTFGVADKATIRAVQTVSDSGMAYQFWTILALDWITTDGDRPAVASISLQFNGESWSMETSLKGATDAGVTVVVAAGNVNNWACDFSPAYVPEAITVAAIDQNNAKASFSNFGDCNNIWAPGVDIRSAVNDSPSASDTWSGTSMATPHVAGGAALLLEENPTMNRDQVLAGLYANAKRGVMSGLKPNDADYLLWVGK